MTAPTLNPTRVFTSSEFPDYETPEHVFRPLHEAFRFTLDVCAMKTTAKVRRYFDPERNGLLQSWRGERCWANPPYNRLPWWMPKAREEVERNGCELVFCLVPMRPDGWYHNTVTAPAGRLRGSWWCPASRTLWRCWERLTVGEHVWPKRIPFLREGREFPGAMFPNLCVVYLPPAERPRPPARPEWGGEGLAPLTWGAPC